jgi:hypothetical protein
LISLGSPHVLRTHMVRTCGEPNDIELTPIRVELHGWACVRAVGRLREWAPVDAVELRVVRVPTGCRSIRF